MISICIPSWNSLEYLKILLPSIKLNSRIPTQIIVVDNGSTDGTAEWLVSRQSLAQFVLKDKNEGFCGVNWALKLAKHPYCMIVNTDMYMLPGWDFAIMHQINTFKREKIDRFTISSCLIEPVGNNPEYDIFYAGHDAQTFDEKKLLQYFSTAQPKKANTTQYSHPILMPKFMLEEVNYLDLEYFPGWSVDHDMPMSFYQKGCRNFIMLGNSRVFHFSSKTFTKLPAEIKNKHGQDIFERKWGISVDEFRNKLKIAQPYARVADGLFSK
jgi:glycosyltransferase involved in cell wall biosynthesis